VPSAPHLADAAEGALPYPVWIGRRAVDEVGAVAATAAPAHRWAVIADSAVAERYGARVVGTLPSGRATLFTVPPGEEHKTRASWARLTDEMLDAGCGRDTTVVALGGGVVGDLAGFVAATFMRGVPVVQVPTTLLAMVDASVGGKTAVDVPAGKNLVGAFHPPAAVVVDPLVLVSLPQPELKAGLAEVVKHGVIADAAYLARVAYLLPGLRAGAPPVADVAAWDAVEAVIARSIAIKAGVVASDEREGGLRKILNYGHTVGHAVEILSGFSLRHGEAVAIGMVVEADAAERAGIAQSGTADTVREVVRRAGLPDRRPPDMAPEAVVHATRTDKKARAGAVEYALPERVGTMASAGGRWSVPLPDEVVLGALA
jgi:3-dehydroquinate synthase